jgi:Kef-type K+ transport system membrane component KefB
LDLFFILLILLVATRTFGELAERFGQPSLVGELVTGIIIGVLLAIGTETDAEMFGFRGIQNNEVFKAVTDLGMFFIMLFAGIELQPHEIAKHYRAAFSVAIGGMALPLALGFGLGWWFLPHSEYLLIQALFVGTALAITAVPATVRILMDLGRLHSRTGHVIIAAAVFDDVLSLLLLAWLTGFLVAGGAPSIGEVALLGWKIVIFFGVTAFVGIVIYPRGGKLLKHVREKELEISVVLIAALAFSVFADWLGLHFILGAFVAGAYFGRKTVDKRTHDEVRSKISAMTFGFLAPIFFASVGLNLDLSAFTEIPLFLTLLVVAAFAGKFFGAGAMAMASGISRGESAAIGIGMSARGAVELVIADIALEAGLFSIPGIESPVIVHMFSAVVIMAVVTTVATPILLKQILTRWQVE